MVLFYEIKRESCTTWTTSTVEHNKLFQLFCIQQRTNKNMDNLMQVWIILLSFSISRWKVKTNWFAEQCPTRSWVVVSKIQSIRVPSNKISARHAKVKNSVFWKFCCKRWLIYLCMLMKSINQLKSLIWNLQTRYYTTYCPPL